MCANVGGLKLESSTTSVRHFRAAAAVLGVAVGACCWTSWKDRPEDWKLWREVCSRRTAISVSSAASEAIVAQVVALAVVGEPKDVSFLEEQEGFIASCRL